MKSSPLVSVIIPLYNCEKYICQAIDSVLNQTYDNIECIVVDDGSTDGSAAQVRKYADRVRYEYQVNGGASAARNRGIGLARGEYIGFLDSDDYWVSTKLEIQMRVFNEEPGLRLVSTNSEDVRETTSVKSSQPGSQVGYDPDQVQFCSEFRDVFAEPFLLTSTILVSAQVMRDTGGFDESLVTAEDIDFYLRCCWGHTFAKVNQILVYKTRVRNSLGDNFRSYGDHLFVIDRFVKQNMDAMEGHHDLINNQIKFIRTAWIEFLLFYGDGRQARKVLKSSMKVVEIDNAGKLYIKSFFCNIIARLKKRKKQLN